MRGCRALTWPRVSLQLASVHLRDHTPEINRALADLYVSTGSSPAAIVCLQIVVRQHPLALYDHERLLALGVAKADLLALVAQHPVKLPAADMAWFEAWLASHAAVVAGDLPSEW